MRVCAGPGGVGSCIYVGGLFTTKRETQLGGGTTTRARDMMGASSGGRGHGRVWFCAVHAALSPFLAREETTEEGHWDQGTTRAAD